MATQLKRNSKYSEAEWTARQELAACYRIFAMMGWDEMIFNHITVKVPDEEGAFLINPYGLHFSEVCASNLIKIDIEGAEPDMVHEVLMHCTNPALKIVVEVKPSQMRATVKPLHDAGFLFMDLRNDYSWLLHRRVTQPVPVTYDELCRRNRMVDVLATRG